MAEMQGPSLAQQYSPWPKTALRVGFGPRLEQQISWWHWVAEVGAHNHDRLPIANSGTAPRWTS